MSKSPKKQSINSMATEIDAPTLAITSGLHDYWLKARADKSMPRLRDMRPMQLNELMPFVYIINVLDDGADFSIRFMGSAITQSIGADYTGVKLSDFPSHPSSWRAEIYRDVYARKEPIITAVDLGDFERDFTKTESILLPLANDAGDFAMIICAAAQY